MICSKTEYPLAHPLKRHLKKSLLTETTLSKIKTTIESVTTLSVEKLSQTTVAPKQRGFALRMGHQDLLQTRCFTLVHLQDVHTDLSYEI